MKKLGDPANGKKPEQNQKPEQKKESPESGGKEQNSQKPETAGEKDQKSADNGKDNAATLLQLLDDEGKQLRDALRERRRSQRPPVEKDW